tara:strand:+ start:3555 stop:3767 length:213 start_codon:yes stop_codon:yes gene_type:complete
MLLKDQYNFIASTEPTLEDDEYELRADSNYYIQVAENNHYIAHTPKSNCAFRTLKEAMQDTIEAYLRQTK